MDWSLYRASATGNAALVQQLLAAGANVNVEDELYGRSALHRASEAGHAPVVQLLLAAGANVNTTTFGADVENGICAVGAAAQAGHETVVRLLLAADHHLGILAEQVCAVGRAGQARLAAVILQSLARTDTAAAAVAVKESLREQLSARRYGIHDEVAREVLREWMQEVQPEAEAQAALVRDLPTRRADLHQLAVHIAATHQRLQDTAQEVGAAAVQAAMAAVAQEPGASAPAGAGAVQVPVRTRAQHRAANALAKP